MRIFITTLFVLFSQVALTQVTLETEVKISDIGLHFNGSKETVATANTDPNQQYDYFFGNKISAHGDCVTSYGNYVFVTWYKGGKSERNVMLSRYNTTTGTIATIEFPHQHTGFQNQWWIGESHNTIAVEVSPINKTIHLLYDMHAYGTNKPSDGSLSNDYFRYSYSITNMASLPDEQFTLDKFVTNSTGGYKHLSLNGGEDYSNFSGLTYPQFFRNDAGDVFMYMREGGNNNGAYKFSKYDANTSTWSSFTHFNILNAKNQPEINYNWGLYGNMKYVNGKIRIGFQRRANITDKYQYQNGVYYAFSDNQNGTSDWKSDSETGFTLPLIDPDQIKIMEPGDYVSTTQTDQVRIVDGFDWTVTNNGDVHFISKVKDTENNITKNLHTYRSSSSSTFITDDTFAGGEAIYTSGGNIYVIGLSSGRVFIDKTSGGNNNFTRVYQQSSGKSFRHGKVYINNGKVYYYLMENKNGSAQPLYLQIIDLDLPENSNTEITAIADGNWNLSATWEGGVIPGVSDDVIIPDNMAITVSDTQFANSIKVANTSSTSLTINSGGALTVTGDIYLGRFDNGLVVQSKTSSEAMGTLTVGGGVLTLSDDDTTTTTSDKRLLARRTLANDKWYLVSSISSKQPRVNRMTGSDFRTNATPEYAIGVYNNSSLAGSKYEYFSTTLTNSNEVTLGAGMSISVNGTGNSDTTGEFEYKAFFTHGSSITTSIAQDVGTGDALNLLGNPYLSNLNGNNNADATNNLLKVNTGVLDEETIWFWNADTGNFVVKNQSSDAFTVPPLTGFFVKSNEVGGNFSYTTAMETHTASGSVLSKNSKKHFSINLAIASGKENANTSIRFIDGTTTAFDNGYDSSIFGGYAIDFEVYTNLVGEDNIKKLAIQSLPNSNLETMIVPVGLNAFAYSDITFTAEALNVPVGYNVYLEDRLNNTFTRLDEANAEYKATMTESAKEGRFYIHVKTSVLSVESGTLNSVKIFKSADVTLKIVGLFAEKAKLTLYNMLGKQVFHHLFIANGTKEITLPKLSQGVYIVQLESKKGSINKKIVLD